MPSPVCPRYVTDVPSGLSSDSATAFVSPCWSGQDPSVVRAQSCLSVVVHSMLVSCSVRVVTLMVPTSSHIRHEPHYWVGGGWELPYLRCSAPTERFY